MGSGLCAFAPRCLSTENAGRTMTVSRHALFGHDFHQTPVSIIISEKCSKFFTGFVGDATQQSVEQVTHPSPIPPKIRPFFFHENGKICTPPNNDDG